MEDWLTETGNDKGAVVPAQTMYDMSGDWYGPRMNVDWNPPTPEEVKATFAKHGLVGEFWSLTFY